MSQKSILAFFKPKSLLLLGLLFQSIHSFSLQPLKPPLSIPGSNPCMAIPLTTGQCISVDNTGLPGSGMNAGCASQQGHDIWFILQVPASGNVSFETDSGSLTDTGMAVWTDTTCVQPMALECDDDSGNDFFSFIPMNSLLPGQTLYIQVWGWGGATSTFRICARDIGTVVLDSTELPIVMINTLGQTIVKGTKINALMDIKFNGLGNITHVTDSSNVYSGHIGIEIRGTSSASYIQHPFGIETRTSSGSNNNVSLLGMPAENDWVLISNFNDRSLIRNTLGYKLFGEMGHYSPKTRLCEVMIDSSYKGIYVLCEKIKRDSNRIAIAKLTPADTSGDQLTGGYILSQNIWNSTNSFLSGYSPIDHPGLPVHFLYEYPDENALAIPQKIYIAAYIDSLESALYGNSFADSLTGYRNFLDVNSFIDYFIAEELTRNNDGFKKSVYFYKDKYSKGGKLMAGPVWDLDYAWKNLVGCPLFSATDGSGWAYQINDCIPDNNSCGWYVRLLQDSSFANALRCTYNSYRQSILDTAFIFAYIDSVRSLVQNAKQRHFQLWPVLGKDGAADEVGEAAVTYDAELDTLKDWISLRLQWLDANMPGSCIPVISSITSPENPATFILNCFPNSGNGNFKLVSNQTIKKVTITNSIGELVYQSPPNSNPFIHNIVGAAGVYFINVSCGSGHKIFKYLKN